MCGIAGIIYADQERPVEPDLLKAMGECDRTSRPGRRRLLVRAGGRPGASTALDHRPGGGRSADRQRGRLDPGRLQRRDLQLSGAAPRARGARAPLPDPERYRGPRPPLRGARGGPGRSAARDVRVRPVGSGPPGAAAGPRSAGPEAAVCLPGCGEARLRLGAQGDPGDPGGLPRDRPGRAGGLSGLWDGPRGEDDLPGHREAAAGPRANGRPGPARGIGPPLLAAPDRAGSGPDGRGVVRGDPRQARRDRPAAPDRRRPGRCLPERGDRLQPGGRLGRRRDRRGAADLLDGVRRGAVQRAAVRPRGRRAVRHAAHRGDRHARRRRPDRRADPLLRRAVRRLLGDPDVPGGAAGKPERQGGAVGRRRRRGLRRLRAVRTRPEGGGVAEGPAGLVPPGGPGPAGPRLAQGRLAAAAAPRQDGPFEPVARRRAGLRQHAGPLPPAAAPPPDGRGHRGGPRRPRAGAGRRGGARDGARWRRPGRDDRRRRRPCSCPTTSWSRWTGRAWPTGWRSGPRWSITSSWSSPPGSPRDGRSTAAGPSGSSGGRPRAACPGRSWSGRSRGSRSRSTSGSAAPCGRCSKRRSSTRAPASPV